MSDFDTPENEARVLAELREAFGSEYDDIYSKEEKTPRHLLEQDIEALHTDELGPVLMYAFDAEGVEPLQDSGEQLPLLPAMFRDASGQVIQDPLVIESSRKLAIESAIKVVAEWNADLIAEFEGEYLTISDYKIYCEKTGKQEFIRILTNLKDPGQQTYMTIYFDTPPLPAGEETLVVSDDSRRARIRNLLFRIRFWLNK